MVSTERRDNQQLTNCNVKTGVTEKTYYIQQHIQSLTVHAHTCQHSNVNVSVYSLKSPMSSADLTIYTPGIGTLSYSMIRTAWQPDQIASLYHA